MRSNRPMNAINIFALRPAEDEDEAFIFDAFTLAMREYVEWAWGWDDAVQREAIRKQLAAGMLRVICVGDQSAGVILVEDREDHLWVRMIFLLPAFQRQGIGAAVLEEVWARARSVGKSLGLRVIRINPARQLYEKLGFRVVAEDEVSLSMKKG